MDHTVQGWEDLSRLVFHYRKAGHWIFRGVTHDSHELLPKIGRPGARRSVSGGSPDDLGYSRDSEKLTIDMFIRAARPYIAHNPNSRIEWLAVAQHHGMHTRLLDWTESLFVAAFFSVLGGGDSRPTIYAARDVPLAPPRVDDIDDLTDVVLYYPPHISPRIPAQHSVFTVHKNPDDVYEPPELERIFLRGPNPLTYRLNLDAVGINMASLFPDIDGLCDHISWRYKWDVLRPG